MAELNVSGTGARSVVLVNKLGISRAMLGATLSTLIEAELVMRNPGYGHPLRPEYVLTESGKRVAPDCTRFEALADGLAVGELAYRKWTAPLLLAIFAGASRFNAMQSALPGISPRALTSALKALGQAVLLNRLVEDGYPPATAYVLTRSGRRLAKSAAQMADALSGAS